jgi:predicted DNA-binding protein (UPF0251 family)
MVKPRKKRHVLYPPWMHAFGPHGHMPFGPGREVILTIDEYESIRLADHEDLKQEQAARKMNISRPTFTRLVDSARKKIADAMVNGKILRIKGGSYVFLKNRLMCMSCGNIWTLDEKKGPTDECPACGSERIEDVGRRFGMGRAHWHGHRKKRGRPHV